MLSWSEKLVEIIMANELYLKKVISFQNEFLKRLEVINKGNNSDIPELVLKLQNYDDQVIQIGLGDFGGKLKKFILQADLSHPEFPNAFDGILSDNQDFSLHCRELLSLANFVKQENLNLVLPLFNQFLYKEYKTAIKKIEIPSVNRVNVRFLKDKEEREQIRCSKKMQIIDLQGIYKKGKSFWDAQPNHFSRFLRFDTGYQDELKKAEKKVKRYEELGCRALADEVQKTMDLFREHTKCNYFGFNRITMTTASVILAKSLGYVYVEDNSGDKIVVNRKAFFNFNPEPLIEYNPYVSIMNGINAFTEKPQTPYDYEPRVYPYYEFASIASEETQKIISHLENFPDVGNKPIFDHFGVIVPSVDFPLRKSDSFTFLDKSGILRVFDAREDATKNLDKMLIENKDMYPIIIGEKDGKCYFISYFQ